MNSWTNLDGCRYFLLDKYIVWENGDPKRGTKYSKYSLVFAYPVKAAIGPINRFWGISCLDCRGKYPHVFAIFGPPNTIPILPDNVCVKQGSEKWIAQIAAILDKMPSIGQIRF